MKRAWRMAAAMAALAMAVPSMAADRTWDGDADANWNNPANWDGDASIPADGDTVIFPEKDGTHPYTGGTTITLGADRTLGGLTFQNSPATTGNIRLQGNTLILNAAATVNHKVAVAANAIDSAVNLAGAGVTIDFGTGDPNGRQLYLNGIVSDFGNGFAVNGDWRGLLRLTNTGNLLSGTIQTSRNHTIQFYDGSLGTATFVPQSGFGTLSMNYMGVASMDFDNTLNVSGAAASLYMQNAVTINYLNEVIFGTTGTWELKVNNAAGVHRVTTAATLTGTGGIFDLRGGRVLIDQSVPNQRFNLRNNPYGAGDQRRSLLYLNADGVSTVRNITVDDMAFNSGGNVNPGTNNVIGGSHAAGLVEFKGALTYSDDSLGTVSHQIDVDAQNAGAITRVSGIIRDGTQYVGIRKLGNGIAEFTNANTYTGPTLVSAGTLLVGNSAGSATGSGPVTVTAGTTLGGSGAVSGTVTAAGTVRPGTALSPTGTLATGNATLAGPFRVAIDGAASSSLAVTGDLTLTGTCSLVVDTVGAPTAETYTVITYTGTRTGAFPADPADYAIIYDDANGRIILDRQRYTVSFQAGANGLVNGSAALTYSVSQGSDVTAVTAQPDPGYIFAGWSGDYLGMDNPLTLTNIQTDMAVTASTA